jgi:hypothetical protein
MAKLGQLTPTLAKLLVVRINCRFEGRGPSQTVRQSKPRNEPRSVFGADVGELSCQFTTVVMRSCPCSRGRLRPVLGEIAMEWVNQRMAILCQSGEEQFCHASRFVSVLWIWRRTGHRGTACYRTGARGNGRLKRRPEAHRACSQTLTVHRYPLR